jgi:hypothetical protein
LTLNDDDTVSIEHDVLDPDAPSPTSKRYRGDRANGTMLLDRLIESDKTVNVVIETGKGNRASASDSKNAANGKGSNATVYFDPTFNPNILTTDPETGNVSGTKRPNYIGLGHELIHADHYTRGVYQTGRGDYNYQTGRTAWTWGIFSGYDYTYKTQNQRQEEFATVGLKYSSWNDITENMLRSEHGLNMRGAY